MSSNNPDPEFSDGTNKVNDDGNFDSPVVANQNSGIVLPNNRNGREENAVNLSVIRNQNDNHDEDPLQNQPGSIPIQNNLTKRVGGSNGLIHNITPSGTLNTTMPRETPVISFPLDDDNEEIVIIENYFDVGNVHNSHANNKINRPAPN